MHTHTRMQDILEGLSPLAPRIAFLHIIRDTSPRRVQSLPGGAEGVRTSVLVTLDSVEAAEGWAAMTAEGRGTLSKGSMCVHRTDVRGYHCWLSHMSDALRTTQNCAWVASFCTFPGWSSYRPIAP